jgi:hypothetical protein
MTWRSTCAVAGMFSRIFCASLAVLLWASSASAITIQLDYTYDLQDGGDFFGTHPTAKATLEQAAADLSVAITSSFTTVPGDTFTGSSGGYTATIDWDLFFTNPVTGAEVQLETWSSSLFPTNVVRIYVGMQPLDGATLGMGGAGSAGISVSVSGSSGNPATAVGNAAAASNAVMPRGAGPSMGTFEGSLAGVDYSVSFGLLTGSLLFDNDTDNDGAIDGESTLDSYWHFELTTPSLDGQNDFYSVALHELIHAIGFGIGAPDTTWGMQQSGTDWSGVHAGSMDPNGGVGLLTLDGHIRDDFMSPRLGDGVLQEPAMTSSILQGTRKSLTQLDLAFLRDLNFATVPEPSVGLLLVGAVAFGLTSRRKSP